VDTAVSWSTRSYDEQKGAILLEESRKAFKKLQDFILNDEGYTDNVSTDNKLTLDPRRLLKYDDVLINKT